MIQFNYICKISSMFRRNINTRSETIKFIRRCSSFILTILYTYNLHTSSYNRSQIVLCCLTRRVTFMTCRLVFITRRLMFMSSSLLFVTRRLVFFKCRLTFMSLRIVFVTRRVQKCSFNKFSKTLIFVSSSQSPTGM